MCSSTSAASSTPSIVTSAGSTFWRWIFERAIGSHFFLGRAPQDDVILAMLDLFPSREAGPFGRRLKRERGARIPVTVVTGFLGAGKTTLIRRFLASPEGHGTAVIVNEYGAVGIDDALLRGSADQTVLLGNGCMCCITRSDLQLALRQLLIDREHGEVPRFARVVIETSGLADPAPILQTFSTDRALGGEFHIDVMLAVVDAVNGESRLDGAAEARKQVILADRVVISKTDLAMAADVERLSRRLHKLNPRAPVDGAVGGALDVEHFIAPAGTKRGGFIAEAEHSDGISSFVLEWQQPIEWLVFARAMETLLALRGADLLRVKGFLDVTGCQGPVVVQYVQHLSHPPVELQTWPDKKRGSRVVFITRGILEAQVRDLFVAVANLGAKPANGPKSRHDWHTRNSLRESLFPDRTIPNNLKFRP